MIARLLSLIAQPPLRPPWTVSRVLRRHPTGSGIVVYGHWIPIRVPGDDRRWWHVSVGLDDRWLRRGLSSYVRGPKWIDAAPGKHVVYFANQDTRLKSPPSASTNLLATYDVELTENQVVLIAFTPPVRGGHMWPKREASWAVVSLR